MPSQPDDVVRSAKRGRVWSGPACRIHNQWFFRYRLLCESIRGCPHEIPDNTWFVWAFQFQTVPPDLRARSSHAFRGQVQASVSFDPATPISRVGALGYCPRGVENCQAATSSPHCSPWYKNPADVWGFYWLACALRRNALARKSVCQCRRFDLVRFTLKV